MSNNIKPTGPSPDPSALGATSFGAPLKAMGLAGKYFSNILPKPVKNQADKIIKLTNKKLTNIKSNIEKGVSKGVGKGVSKSIDILKGKISVIRVIDKKLEPDYRGQDTPSALKGRQDVPKAPEETSDRDIPLSELELTGERKEYFELMEKAFGAPTVESAPKPAEQSSQDPIKTLNELFMKLVPRNWPTRELSTPPPTSPLPPIPTSPPPLPDRGPPPTPPPFIQKPKS